MDNVELRCRAHNGYEAERHFGRWSAVREELAVYAAGAGQWELASRRAITNSLRNES